MQIENSNREYMIKALNKIYNWINRHGIITSIIASAIIIALTFFFSKDKKILTYKIVTHEQLFNPRLTPEFSFYLGDSIEISSNVYYCEFDIWNQGNSAIERNNIKEKIKLILNDSSNIIGVPELIQTHPNIINGRISIESSKLSINLDFLEKKNGLKIKFYYTNPSTSKSLIKLEGYISGNSEIKYFNESFMRSSNSWFIAIYFIFTGIIAVFIGWQSSDIGIKIGDKFENTYLRYSIPVLSILFSGVISYFFIKFVKNLLNLFTNYMNSDSPFL